MPEVKRGVGFYRPTTTFKAQKEHIAVLDESTGELLCLTGYSDPADKDAMVESIADAIVYSGAHAMLELVKEIALDPDSPHRLQAKAILESMRSSTNGMASAVMDMGPIRSAARSKVGL